MKRLQVITLTIILFLTTACVHDPIRCAYTCKNIMTTELITAGIVYSVSELDGNEKSFDECGTLTEVTTSWINTLPAEDYIPQTLRYNGSLDTLVRYTYRSECWATD